MTIKIEEAIKVLKSDMKNLSKDGCDDTDLYLAEDLAIEALQKQEPKKPDIRARIYYGEFCGNPEQETRYFCKCSCGETLCEVRPKDNWCSNKPNYCPNCGQRIDWSTG